MGSLLKMSPKMAESMIVDGMVGALVRGCGLDVGYETRVSFALAREACRFGDHGRSTIPPAT